MKNRPIWFGHGDYKVMIKHCIIIKARVTQLGKLCIGGYE